jgi:hypothetical protein
MKRFVESTRFVEPTRAVERFPSSLSLTAGHHRGEDKSRDGEDAI